MKIPREFWVLIPFAMALLVAILSWKYAHFFLSRRDYYINSRYNLLVKKLGWSISSFVATLYITFKVLEIFMKKYEW